MNVQQSLDFAQQHALESDIALATGAITSPWWVQSLHDWLALVAVAGGVILLLLRIWLAVRELRRKKQQPPEGV